MKKKLRGKLTQRQRPTGQMSTFDQINKHLHPFLLLLSGLTEISFANQLLSLELFSLNNSPHFEMYFMRKMLIKSFCVATPSQLLKVQTL